MDLQGLSLITGPTNSGKSIFAEKLASHYRDVLYISTLVPDKNDTSLMMRIQKHKERRPSDWRTIEAGSNLIEILNSINSQEIILIDSLGGFVASTLDDSEICWNELQNQLFSFFKYSPVSTILVSEEVGWGVVPSTPIGNIYRERLTSISTLLSNIATHNWLVIQGRALNLSLQGIKI